MAFTRSLPIITFLVVVLSSSQHQIAGAGDDDEIRNNSGKYPLVISTWPFREAVRAAWRAVDGGLSAVDAVVEGCSACEELRCDVGPGGSPDEDGETTIDALVMNGVTMEVGAVAAMRFVKDGIRAARLVMQHTKHTLLVGEKASDFAISMGLPGPTDLSSSDSVEKWSKWKASSCQPNFWKNVSPVNGCGPYEPIHTVDVKDGTCSIINLVGDRESRSSLVGPHNHDTISMAAIDKMGHVACGTSTNGATFKIPGRVGDGPIAGSSAYAIDEVGACGATGDGDIMMRFLPCYQVVESMRLGMEPGVAAKDAISRITKKFPDFVGAVFAVNKNGVHSGACHGWTFQYSVRSPEMDDVQRQSTCLGLRVFQGVVTEIKLADTYSVEFINYGLVRGPNIIKVGKRLLGRDFPNHEMYRFLLRSVRKSTSQPSVLVPTTCIFGHEDSQTCQTWVERVDASLKSEFGRPKNLMVFVNPKSGKTNGYRTWESVSPIFSHAKVKTNVIVTQRAGHAFDVMASTANGELNSYDGFICVGGDGFFNELLNGFLLSRHKASYPPCPSDLVHYDESDASAPDSERGNAEISGQNEEQFHLLPDSTQNRYKATSIEDGSYNSDHDADFSFEKFRFGIIPAGSTDAIVMCTTGARDPVTSALHIVLGKRLHLDLAQVVSWKSSATSEAKPCVRYAASFAGYGFYGDVITESEKYRWMGPKRYDYAGTKVFMRHRSYEAEIAYMESESEKSNYKLDKGSLLSRVKDICIPDKSERTICRANCGVCNMKPLNVPKRLRGKPYSRPEGYKWRKCKGHFLSVGAAIMSNRNERAPDGLVADAHLSDGFLHLLLIRDCPRAHYLCHLTQLAKRGGRPLNFEFVEHHKTSAFTFTSLGEESVWNLDGELFPARQLSAQVFRGLVSLFASGPEV